MQTRMKPKSFGDRLRERRAACGLTQHQLAEATGLQILTLSRLENGHKQPTLDTAGRIADALGCGVDDLR